MIDPPTVTGTLAARITAAASALAGPQRYLDAIREPGATATVARVRAELVSALELMPGGAVAGLPSVDKAAAADE